MSRTSMGRELTADGFFGLRFAGEGFLPRFGLRRPGFLGGARPDEAAAGPERPDGAGAEGRGELFRPAAAEPPVRRAARRFFLEITLFYYPERNGETRA